MSLENQREYETDISIWKANVNKWVKMRYGGRKEIIVKPELVLLIKT